LVTETSRRVALFSIHPTYAEAILQRTKLVEFRRQRLPAQVTNVVIYATSPVQRIVGAFEVVDVEPTTPQMAWSMYRYVGAIERRQFERYYSGAATAFVIKVGATTRAIVPFPLDWIDPMLRPPQSFLYLRDDQVQRTESMLTSNSGLLSHTSPWRSSSSPTSLERRSFPYVEPPEVASLPQEAPCFT
jgi:predicted transcriptional regulator